MAPTTSSTYGPSTAGAGPSCWFEQVSLPPSLRRRRAGAGPRAQLLPAPAAPVPGRRDRPRPRLRGLPRRLLARRTGWKYRDVHAAGGALGRARDLRLAVHRRRRVRALRRRSRAGPRGPATRPSLPIGDAPVARRPLRAGRGRPAPEEEPRRAGRGPGGAARRRRRTASSSPGGLRRGGRCGRPRATNRWSSRVPAATPSSTRCCAAPTCSCTRASTRASGSSLAEAMARGCPSPGAGGTALPETAGGAAVLLRPARRRRHGRRDPRACPTRTASELAAAGPARAARALVGGTARADRGGLPRSCW